MGFSVVVLAAGEGTRMKSSTPKVLHKISGKPMIWHILKEAQKVSDDINVVLYHQANKIKNYLQNQFKNLKFILQDHQNFPGTGGAVRDIKPRYEKVLVLNGDMPLVQANELKKFSQIDADIVLAVFELDEPNGYGRIILKDGEVERIVEEKDATSQELEVKLVNGGVYLFKKEVLEKFIPKLSNDNAQKEYYLTDLIALAKREGLSVKPLFVKEEDFKGVNSKYELAQAEEIMQERIRRYWMKEGVIMRLPSTIYIDIQTQFKGECEIESGVVLKGKNLIDSSVIKSGSVIEESEIKNSTIGPLAHIRPSSKIQNSSIGNFVEVKKSELNGVKAGHLSYLGDSWIDEGTNIGAGTITCNYDGKGKYKTIIGKNVFVGSDSKLIAPLKIEDEVLIGAGSVVNQDVPKGALAISRPNLKIIKEFYYRFFGKKR